MTQRSAELQRSNISASKTEPLLVMPPIGMTFVPMRMYVYGERAAETIAREERAWKAWMNQLFPAPSGEPAAS